MWNLFIDPIFIKSLTRFMDLIKINDLWTSVVDVQLLYFLIANGKKIRIFVFKVTKIYYYGHFLNISFSHKFLIVNLIVKM